MFSLFNFKPTGQNFNLGVSGCLKLFVLSTPIGVVGGLETHPTMITVIASEQSERGNLPAMENAPNPYSDKEIATTATHACNDGNDFSGCLKINTTPPNCKNSVIASLAMQGVAIFLLRRIHQIYTTIRRLPRLLTQSRNDSNDFSGCLKTNNNTTEPPTVIASEAARRSVAIF